MTVVQSISFGLFDRKINFQLFNSRFCRSHNFAAQEKNCETNVCAVVITEYTLDGTAPNISNEVINQWIILSSQIYKQPDFKVVDKIVTSLIST